ncbi:tetratricopeptide repeat protein [Pseudomonas prosekii]|uniref:tetratricopeptide repeat protein n=1 Tax=Pseudomonas prosekii TaxID=1148509 RepID=UPI0011EB1494|nr:tetratricopeptide repeat protein [Pseudomonas prosekii]
MKKRINFYRYIFHIILLLACFEARASLTSDQLAAKEKGIELYDQFKAISALPYLQISADAGDDEAQYYLGEAIRKNRKFIDNDAKTAYEKSAKQGNIYSMIRLGRMDEDLCVNMAKCPKSEKTAKEWLAHAESLANKQAGQGNAESMYLLYEITGKNQWLEKSAENGYPLAQYLLATEYQEGGGFFVLPSSRTDVIERWMKASAENGYPRAMSGIAAILVERKDAANARAWVERAAATGYVEALFNYGYYLAGKNSEFGFSADYVKSYALLSLFLELDGGGGAKEDAEYVISKIKTEMSKSQLDEAEIFAANWKKTHPALSFFPFKLSR